MRLVFVCTDLFDRTAAVAFRDGRERAACMRSAEDELQANPERGDLMPRTGGARKLRVALPGRGKRGGGRAIDLYMRVRSKVYLLNVLPKERVSDAHE
jgi:hypothetical protein